jgi:peptidyl-prolyl cis-trans isomerase D
MIRILQKDNWIIKALFAVIIGGAIIAMVFALIPGIFDNGAGNDPTVYAKVRTPGAWDRVFGEPTTITTLDVEREARAQMQRQNLPDFYLQFIMSRAGTLQVERAVLMHEADKLGLQVSDEDLRNFLKSGPYAQYLFPNGTFIGDDRYIDFVQQYFNLPVKQFETEVKSDLELQRLQAMVTGGVSVSDAAVKAQYLQTGTKVQFDYAVISAATIKATINPSDAELQAFFKQNGARYANAVPETRKISFFTFDASQVPGGKPAISDAEIAAFYNQNAAQYKTPEQVKTRHILITVPKGADAKTDAAAKAKIEGIAAQLKAGGNFAELAKKNSEDPGSKDNGGELPMIPTASLDPAYAQAAMALSPGQTSPVVRSSFGYHIIQTEEKQAAATKPLNDVKPQIVAALTATKGAAAEQSFATQLAAEAKKSGLQKTADAHGLHLQTSDYVARAGGVIPSLSDSTSLISSAFTTTKDAAPQVVSTGEGYAVFQVTDIKAAHAPEFADWKSHVLDDYREQKAPALLQDQLTQLSQKAQALHDLKKAAAAMNLRVKTSDLVGRDAQVPEIGALSGAASVVFTLPVGGVSAPVNEGANGAVLQLSQKVEPTADDIAKNMEATREKLLDTKRQEAFQVFVGTLMDRYEKAGAVAYTKKQPVGPLGQ